MGWIAVGAAGDIGIFVSIRSTDDSGVGIVIINVVFGLDHGRQRHGRWISEEITSGNSSHTVSQVAPAIGRQALAFHAICTKDHGCYSGTI